MSLDQERNTKLPKTAASVKATPKLYHQNLNLQEALKFMQVAKYRVRRRSWRDESTHAIISVRARVHPPKTVNGFLSCITCFSRNRRDEWGISEKDFLATDWEASLNAEHQNLSFDDAMYFVKKRYKIWRDAWKPEEKWVGLCKTQRHDALSKAAYLRVYDGKQHDVMFTANSVDTASKDWNADCLKVKKR